MSVRPIVRWCAAGVVGVTAFALTEWLCGRIFGLDQNESLAIAGLAAAVTLTPLGYWASHETQHKTAGHLNQPFNEPPQPVERSVIVGNVPQEQWPYQRREDLIAKLNRPVDGRVPIVHVLTGMSGVGKTYLAGECARARINAHWRLVAWIEAESKTSFLNGLADVASRLGLTGAQPDARAAGKEVRTWLEADGDRCLLVFNSAADPSDLRPFIPAGGCARILITSNHESMTSLGVGVPVDTFTPEEALGYLEMRIERSDPVAVAELAAELGCLPLALAQAVPLIARMGYVAYLDLLHNEPVGKLLRSDHGDPYPRGAPAAILLALDAAEKKDDTAAVRPIMEVMSVLSAAGTPPVLLHAAARSPGLRSHIGIKRMLRQRIVAMTRALAGSNQRFVPLRVLATEARDEILLRPVDEALAQLAEVSLVTFSEDWGHVRAHPLVMRVVRERMARQGRFELVCCAVGELLLDRAKSVRQQWEQSAVRNLIDQVLNLIKNVETLSDEPGNELTRCVLKLRLEIARFQDDLGDNATKAIQDAEKLLADTERDLGSEDLYTLYARHNLAIAYQQAGRDDDAIALHEKNLAERERILDADDRDTCASRNNLAIAYQDAGRITDAIALHKENLAIREQKFGADDRDTCASRNNLAIAYQDAGRITDAIALHEINVTYAERHSGADSSDARTSPPSPATVYYAASRVGEVIPLHESILADGERVIRTGHPDGLGYKNNLATAYLQADRLNDAIAWLERTLGDKEEVLGAEHPRTQTSRNNLAVAYLKIGRIDEAIKLLKDAIAVLKPIMDIHHRTRRIVQGNLSRAEEAKERKGPPPASQEKRPDSQGHG